MHYSIFVPRSTGNQPSLREVGLHNLADSGGFSQNEDRLQGKPGVLWGYRKGNLPVDSHSPFRADAIPKWEEFYDGKFHVGWDPNRPPMPVELAKKDQVLGRPIILADRSEWIIPQAKKLPHRHRLDRKTGKWERAVASRYEDFCQRAAKLMDEVFQALDSLDMSFMRINPDSVPAEDRVKIEIHDCCQLCVDALSINYRLEAEIVDALCLLDDATATEVSMSIVDLQDIIAVRDEKKTEYLDIPLTSTTCFG